MLWTLIVMVFLSTVVGGNLPLSDRSSAQLWRELDVLRSEGGGGGPLPCHVCAFLAAGLRTGGAAPIATVGRLLCRAYVAITTGASTTFCDDIIDAHTPIFTFILEHSKIYDPEYACSVLLQDKRCYSSKAPLRWTVEVPPEGVAKRPQELAPGPPLRILHVTDVHLQADYAAGARADCGLPLCCKATLRSSGRAAGAWGDHLCDSPLATFRHALRTARDELGAQPPDLIYFTGDVVDHTSWRSSRASNSDALRVGYGAFEEFFPGVRVLPVVGNHESAPLNAFAPDDPAVEDAGLSTAWLYELLASLWARWLPRESLGTVRRQGYYSVDINPRFKVVSLNNNVCYNFNWWLLYDTAFLLEQLEFLRDQLVEAESRGQFVHILTHIPVGNKECVEPWERSYVALIRRYSHLVKGQFFGHTHTDELKVFYSANGTVPINVAFNGASLTPYQNYNPNYKVLHVDGDTYDVLDVDTYTFNLTRANEGSSGPEWYKLYSMRDAYGLRDLRAESVHGLVERIRQDEGTFQKYWRFYVREGDPSLKKGCDVKCRKKMLCEISSTESIKADC